MTTPAKNSSRWGSFLQQALDGVESRLDNILVGDGLTEPTSVEPSEPSTKPENVGPSRISNAQSTNDRLQERLAKAIAAKKYTAARPDSNSSSSRVPSRVGSPATTAETSRQSVDSLPVGIDGASGEQTQTENHIKSSRVPEKKSDSGALIGGQKGNDANNALSKTSLEESPRPSLESSSSHAPESSEPQGYIAGQLGLKSTDIDLMGRSQNELELSDLQRQEEIHGYIERIDALQAKLQYLSRESAESARKAAVANVPGSTNKKLAEKDEQIALLMEEGQKLSKTEMKHMILIKKLRAKALEADKEIAEAKRKVEKSDREKATQLERLKRGESIERQLTDKQKTIAQLQRDLETATAERDANSLTIGELKVQLLESASQATASEVKAAQELLAAERLGVAELENQISSLRIEKEVAVGRAKAQLEELRAKSEREAERCRATEVEMRVEQQMLEGRLEAMRMHAEEVSSGALGDAQAKILRQVETLQTQYAIASDNWQGIEASLTSRLTSLGKERDEALKRETELKRKGRELTIKSKRNEEELEDSYARIHTLQRELIEIKEQNDRLLQHTDGSESALTEAKKAFDQEIQILKADIQQRVDEDRVKSREDPVGHSPLILGGAESPSPSWHRNLTADLLGLQNLQIRTPGRSFTNDVPPIDSRASPKSSTQYVPSPGQATPQRHDSAQSYINGEVTEPSSANLVENDYYFEHVLSPSPTHAVAQDILSISTVGAGPSVQLVERMSAAIRRLESEKVSTREELKRLSGQRDEARAQTVMLMQEVEAKRIIDKRVHELEEENKKINARYQTTLEMLGEKSELVEELRADVQDVKDMYRDLVERTVK